MKEGLAFTVQGMMVLVETGLRFVIIEAIQGEAPMLYVNQSIADVGQLTAGGEPVGEIVFCIQYSLQDFV